MGSGRRSPLGSSGRPPRPGRWVPAPGRQGARPGGAGGDGGPARANLAFSRPYFHSPCGVDEQKCSRARECRARAALILGARGRALGTLRRDLPAPEPPHLVTGSQQFLEPALRFGAALLEDEDPVGAAEHGVPVATSSDCSCGTSVSAVPWMSLIPPRCPVMSAPPWIHPDIRSATAHRGSPPATGPPWRAAESGGAACTA